MTSTLHRTATASAGAALLLVLAACGGGGGGGGNDDDGGASSSSDLPKGPIDELYEEMYRGDNEEAMNQQMMDVEERTAACMAEQGFEYIPVDWTQGGGFDPGEELDVEWGTLEFAEKYGYGATTNPYGDGTEAPGAEEWVNPNDELVSAMSETEVQAYNEALWGPPVESTGDEPVEWTWETGGCQGRAQHEVDVENGVGGEEFEALQDEMEAMWMEIENDPKLVELNAEWASCMADAGYPGFAAPTDAETSIYDKVNAVYDEVYAGASFDENTTEEDWAAVEEQVQEQLGAITEEEMKTALADYTCREDVDMLRTQAEINVEHQQAFYDAHKQELEAWRDAVVASR
ncbi:MULTISPECIES: hypothetical protein [unclassified Actinotalea]|uniref:hypothetical protein n=1 Tax=unclassified Actinotalea TaxID=2638618 RepID=UPI0015F6A4FF|nr:MULTISPECIES: hypothetical protein [unclassified Actinotalea]